MSRLYIFNPDCELAIANGGQFYTPPANIARMMEELAFLPAWIGGEGDGVLVKEVPDSGFLVRAEELGLKCQPVLEAEVGQGGTWEAEPWGQSPKMNHWLAERGLGTEWRPEQKEWYSRTTAREGLRRIMEVCPWVERGLLPRVCRTLEDIRNATRGGMYLVKAPWSSSGKGLLVLQGLPTEKEEEWLRGILRRQGYVMVEKKQNKFYDFAMEFRAGVEGMNFIGWSVFMAGTHGEYKGNVLASPETLEEELGIRAGEHILQELKERMPLWLRELLPHYRGYLGVDMMVYQNIAGKRCIHPCVEINLRYNMGIMALGLSKRWLAEGAQGWFDVAYYPGPGEALVIHQYRQKEYPLVYKNNRISSGYLNLTPVRETTKWVASLRCY